MKTIKSIIAATLLIAGTTVMAQTQTTVTNNYADQAFEKTSELASSLNLSNEQTLEILAIYQNYSDMEANIATNAQLSKREAKRAQKELIAARTMEIKSVLNGNQIEKFDDMIAAPYTLIPQSTPSVTLNNASQTIFFNTDAATIIFSLR